MRFRDCLTADLYARKAIRLSLGDMLKQLVFDCGYRVVVYYRVAIFLREVRYPKLLGRLLCSLILMRLCRVPGVEFRTEHEIGEGLLMYHPHDIVLGAGCRIGRNVTTYNGVTLGALTLKAIDKNKDISTRYPVIEDGVTIFSGAKVIGPVRIGKNSIVGANSVVNDSFPENSVIAGVPAILLKKRDGQ